MSIALFWLVFEYEEARRERNELADDLYLLCTYLPEAFPGLKFTKPNPRLREEALQTPFFRTQYAFVRACEMRNGKALYEAQERWLKSRSN